MVVTIEQANNRRNNVLLTYNNKTLNITQWCAELGIKNKILQYRIKKGWSVERALTTPTKNV